MRLLVDTHTLLWFLQGDKRLSKTAANLLESPESIVFVSMASVWEIAIKISLQKLRISYSLDKDLPQFLNDCGFHLLPITFAHVARIQTLPFHHRDPFDRILIAQAMIDKYRIITQDTQFSAYDVDVSW
jgi:PIN domain nuclease of toxin-antitoxin system